MISTLNPNNLYQEELYNKYLKEISGKQFTFREVDVIACILHNRAEKKIASLLGISYRTVGAHVRNIFSKLGENSKDYIIDVVEKSGKLGYIHQYYFHLLIQSSFKNCLQKIGSINHPSIVCSTNFSKAPEEGNSLLSQIEIALKLANISLIDRPAKNDTIRCKFNLYMVAEKLTDGTNQDLEFIKSLNHDSSSRVLLLFINTAPSLPEIGNLEFMEFKLGENYYFSLCNLLDKIIDDPRVTRITKEFIDEYNSLKDLIIIAKTPDNKLPSTKSIPSPRIKPILLVITNIVIIISLVVVWRVISRQETSKSFIKEQDEAAKLNARDLVIQDSINKEASLGLCKFVPGLVGKDRVFLPIISLKIFNYHKH